MQKPVFVTQPHPRPHRRRDRHHQEARSQMQPAAGKKRQNRQDRQHHPRRLQSVQVLAEEEVRANDHQHQIQPVDGRAHAGAFAAHRFNQQQVPGHRENPGNRSPKQCCRQIRLEAARKEQERRQPDRPHQRHKHPPRPLLSRKQLENEVVDRGARQTAKRKKNRHNFSFLNICKIYRLKL
ncbi:hypothetical protein SDC9_140990 [bioreactor metagenome]|uniref:Uncharacterized protein n=1 Tax=bioreactor metagenome TaxID=1076179 RepID=A0A645DXI7_9ZZZZ